VFAVPVPRSGVSYSTEFGWREAAHWAGYRWEVFRTLDGDDQAAIVAHHMAHLQLEAVIAQDIRRS
jgi:hypothetical protein